MNDKPATPQPGAWRGLVDQRYLLWTFVRRDLQMRYGASFMGFFWSVEINPEKPDGTPLAGDEYERYFKGVVSRKLLEGGLICRFDDKDDPVIQFSPALVSDRAVLSRIAEITDEALTELERELGYRG